MITVREESRYGKTFVQEPAGFGVTVPRERDGSHHPAVRVNGSDPKHPLDHADPSLSLLPYRGLRGASPCGPSTAKSHRPVSPQLERLGSVSGSGLFSWLCGTSSNHPSWRPYPRACGSAALPRRILQGSPGHNRAALPRRHGAARPQDSCKRWHRLFWDLVYLWSRVNMAGTHGKVERNCHAEEEHDTDLAIAGRQSHRPAP